jgi:hypothetical protein
MNQTQAKVFDLIRTASFNDFNANEVVDSLIAAPELWRSVVMTDGRDAGLTLRDLEEDFYHVDTLYIFRKGDADALEELARTWSADEVSWLAPKETASLLGSYTPQTREPRLVLRVWWD